MKRRALDLPVDGGEARVQGVLYLVADDEGQNEPADRALCSQFQLVPVAKGHERLLRVPVKTWTTILDHRRAKRLGEPAHVAELGVRVFCFRFRLLDALLLELRLLCHELRVRPRRDDVVAKNVRRRPSEIENDSFISRVYSQLSLS